MTFEERQKVGAYIVHISVYYGRQIGKEVVSMMVDDFEGYTAEQVMQGYKTYRQDSRNRQFPLPAQIIKILTPTANTDDLAKEAAARVIESVSRFGYTNPDDAKNYIGELGWRAVQRFGGWAHVCQNLGLKVSQDTFYAQVRELCKTTLELSAAGINDQPIAIEQGGKVLSLVSQLANQKSLEQKKIED